MLHIVLWKWVQEGFREKYTHEHVNALAGAIKKHINGYPHRIVCVTDDPADIRMDIDVHPLWPDHGKVNNISGPRFPSCYRRLKLFEPETQRAMGINEGDRIMSMDLDTLITNDLSKLALRKERFLGWAVRGTRHIRVFNGSMFMFTQGDFHELWAEFNPAISPKTAFTAGFFGSDQGWLSYKLARRDDCAGWGYPQVASYPRELCTRPSLPKETAVVNFHGADKPWHDKVHKRSPWVKHHWMHWRQDHAV